MSIVMSAGKGVTQVVERCEAAKESGFLGELRLFSVVAMKA